MTTDDILRDDSRRAAAVVLAYIDGDKDGLAYLLDQAGDRLPSLTLALLALIRETAPAVFAEGSRPHYERWVIAASES
jgi:hypothetical protein